MKVPNSWSPKSMGERDPVKQRKTKNKGEGSYSTKNVHEIVCFEI